MHEINEDGEFYGRWKMGNEYNNPQYFGLYTNYTENYFRKINPFYDIFLEQESYKDCINLGQLDKEE